MKTLNNTSLILGHYIDQRTLMKELHIRFDTLKKLQLNVLEPVIIGRQHLYDLEDLKIILNKLKNSSF